MKLLLASVVDCHSYTLYVHTIHSAAITANTTTTITTVVVTIISTTPFEIIDNILCKTKINEQLDGYMGQHGIRDANCCHLVVFVCLGICSLV